jgi:hypothetical protein
MNFCRITTIIMIIAALLVPAVAAQETGSHDYIVTPVEDNDIHPKKTRHLLL